MNELVMLRIVLAIIIGTLIAIAYSMRYLILLERRMKKMEEHTSRLVDKIFSEMKNKKITKKRRK
jgi:uncharacterized membrane protein